MMMGRTSATTSVVLVGATVLMVLGPLSQKAAASNMPAAWKKWEVWCCDPAECSPLDYLYASLLEETSQPALVTRAGS